MISIFKTIYIGKNFYLNKSQMQNEEAPPTIITKKEIPEKNEIIIENKETKHEDTKIDKIKKEDTKKNEEIKKDDKKEESPKIENAEIKTEENVNGYFKNLFKEFEFNFFDDILKPDCTYISKDRIKFVFFDLKALNNILEEKLQELFEKYPKNLDNLKNPLENYMRIFQKEEYKEEASTFGYFIERIKIIFSKESYNRKVQERAIKIAFLLSQLKSKKIDIDNKSPDAKIIIGIIDSFNYKIKPYDYEDLQKINDEIGNLDIRIKNLEEINKSLQLIENKMQIIIDKIENKYNGKDEINQPIFKLYLMKEIDSKLSKIEASNDVIYKSKTYEKMRSIRSEINKCIKDNILQEQKKLFFDLDLEFKIIKNTNKEKKILLDGVNINKFFDEIKKNFVDLEKDLFKFNKDELKDGKVTEDNKKKIFEFLREKMEKLEKWEELEKNLDVEINNIDLNNFEQVFDGGIDATNAVLNFKKININDGLDKTKNIGKKYYKIKENKIVKAFKEKTKAIIKHNKNETIKLIKEYELIDNFEKKKNLIKDGTKINGYIVSKIINDPKNPILDFYSVDII